MENKSTPRTKAFREQKSIEGFERLEIYTSKEIKSFVRYIASKEKITAGIAAESILYIGIISYLRNLNIDTNCLPKYLITPPLINSNKEKHIMAINTSQYDIKSVIFNLIKENDNKFKLTDIHFHFLHNVNDSPNFKLEDITYAVKYLIENNYICINAGGMFQIVKLNAVLTAQDKTTEMKTEPTAHATEESLDYNTIVINDAKSDILKFINSYPNQSTVDSISSHFKNKNQIIKSKKEGEADVFMIALVYLKSEGKITIDEFGTICLIKEIKETKMDNTPKEEIVYKLDDEDKEVAELVKKELTTELGFTPSNDQVNKFIYKQMKNQISGINVQKQQYENYLRTISPNGVNNYVGNPGNRNISDIGNSQPIWNLKKK